MLKQNNTNLVGNTSTKNVLVAFFSVCIPQSNRYADCNQVISKGCVASKVTKDINLGLVFHNRIRDCLIRTDIIVYFRFIQLTSLTLSHVASHPAIYHNYSHMIDFFALLYLHILSLSLFLTKTTFTRNFANMSLTYFFSQVTFIQLATVLHSLSCLA